VSQATGAGAASAVPAGTSANALSTDPASAQGTILLVRLIATLPPRATALSGGSCAIRADSVKSEHETYSTGASPLVTRVIARGADPGVCTRFALDRGAAHPALSARGGFGI
jgi:hypothetical protein